MSDHKMREALDLLDKRNDELSRLKAENEKYREACKSAKAFIEAYEKDAVNTKAFARDITYGLLEQALQAEGK